MLSFNYDFYDEQEDVTHHYWVEVEEFFPARPATQFEEPTDNEWRFTVYDEEGKKTTNYSFADILEEIECEYAMMINERERDEADWASEQYY